MKIRPWIRVWIQIYINLKILGADTDPKHSTYISKHPTLQALRQGAQWVVVSRRYRRIWCRLRSPQPDPVKHNRVKII